CPIIIIGGVSNPSMRRPVSSLMHRLNGPSARSTPRLRRKSSAAPRREAKTSRSAAAPRDPKAHFRAADEFVGLRAEGLLALHHQRRNPHAVIAMHGEGHADETPKLSPVGYGDDLDRHRVAITPSSRPTADMMDTARSICTSVCAELTLERMRERLPGVAG